jgi:hypothetical protein
VEEEMVEAGQASIRQQRVAFGALLMLLGLTVLAERLGFVELQTWWQLWPVLLVGIGLARVAFPVRNRSEGAPILVSGLLLLGHTMGVLPITRYWPLWVIWAGAGVLWAAWREAKGDTR